MYSNPKFIKNMISYIIKEPDQRENPKFFQKFPFNSSEIFFLELEDIINAFFVERSHEEQVNTSEKIMDPEDENNEMMEKCIGYLSKFDLVSSPKKQKKESGNKFEPQNPVVLDDDDMMGRRFSPFKPMDNHFDLFKQKSFQSINEDTNQMTYNYELLDHLFSFLEDLQKPLNLTLAGYFSKVIHALMNKKFMDVRLFLGIGFIGIF